MSFRDVPGQDEAVRFFRVAERTGRLAHAYILAGPEGSGRRALARALGAWLFCENRTRDDACGTCRTCRRVAADDFPDFHWYERPEGKQQLIVEVIEQLRHDIHLKPLESGRTVFVLEDADKLNASSANKLLKVLEEPPPQSLLLLLALDVRDFLPTLLSRCHVVRLRPLSTDDLAGRLEREGACPPAEARYLSHFTMGSPGLASTLAAGGFFRERERLIDLMTGLRPGGHIETADALFKQAGAGSDSTQERREVLLRSLDVMALFYRDVLGSALGDDSTLIHEDRRRQVTELADALGAGRAARVLDEIARTREALLANANQKLLLENLTFDVAQLQSV